VVNKITSFFGKLTQLPLVKKWQLLYRSKVNHYCPIVIDKYKVTSVKTKKHLNNFLSKTPREKFNFVKKPLLFLIILLVIIKFVSFIKPPKIITVFPENHSQENPLKSEVEIIFDREMNPVSVERSFKISPFVNGKFRWENNQKLIFIPDKNLTRNQKYQVKFDGLIFSANYIPLFNPKNIEFETIGDPKIILYSPSQESLEDLSVINIIFDRPMISLTVINDDSTKKNFFTISPPLKGEGRWLGTTAYQFRPSQPYKKSTTYTITVSKGLKSEDDGVLKQDFRERGF